jgi:hypothetical protein
MKRPAATTTFYMAPEHYLLLSISWVLLIPASWIFLLYIFFLPFVLPYYPHGGVWRDYRQSDWMSLGMTDGYKSSWDLSLRYIDSVSTLNFYDLRLGGGSEWCGGIDQSFDQFLFPLYLRWYYSWNSNLKWLSPGVFDRWYICQTLF